MSAKPQLYFHLGIERTGTKFLQDVVFPHFKGIEYVHRDDYSTIEERMEKTTHEKVFLSFEYNLNDQFINEVPRMAKLFPDLKPIVVFRKQHSWLISQYKRFTKNGFHRKFKDFLDLENNQGHYKLEDLSFKNRIEYLEKHFRRKPYVLFYDDFKKDKDGFLLEIAQLVGARFDPDSPQRKTKHTSYGEKEVKAMFWLSKYVNVRRERVFKSQFLQKTQKKLKDLIRYPFIGLSKLLPETTFVKGDLIPDDYVQKIKAYYRADWEACRAYAFKNNSLD